MMVSEFDIEYAKEQLRRSHHPLRRLIKSFYIKNILRDVTGLSIDFGCGAGQLLTRLPRGSLGLEINPWLIESLVRDGLNVMCYDVEKDQFALAELPENRYSTFIMAHVLEHFAEATQILRTLFGACRRLGIKRFILVVPGWNGYLRDPTHKTFINRRFLQEEGLMSCEGYRLKELRYFPVNLESVGKYFVFHELTAVFDRVE